MNALTTMRNLPVLICGGDKREVELFHIWDSQGFLVKTAGLEDSNIPQEKKVALPTTENFNVIILPIWGIDSRGNINTKVSGNSKVLNILSLILNTGRKPRLVLTGSVADVVRKKTSPDIRYILTSQDEELVLLNSILTAEGVIYHALGDSDNSLYGSNVLVLGMGRCGTSLALRLQGLGAEVKVAVRNQARCALADSYKLNPVLIEHLSDEVKNTDIAINTIPDLILTGDVLKHFKKSALILDIASHPGGVDFKAAEKMDLKARLLPGLPGKIAPRAAAINLARVYSRIIKANLGFVEEEGCK